MSARRLRTAAACLCALAALAFACLPLRGAQAAGAGTGFAPLARACAPNVDPDTLAALVRTESGFNPYAESGVGAQGLMQVMSKVHSDKFEYFGGSHAALDPLANIKVGALVLKDCIARGGSVAGGLRYYVGSSTQDDGGYGAKVLAERTRLRDVARGRNVPINAPQAPVT